MRKIIRAATFGLTEIDGEDIWRCTTCGRCPAQCPRGVKQIELGVSLRRVAAGYEVFPASVKSARTARASLISEGNPLQVERQKRGDWAKEHAVKPYSEGMELLFFVGCYLSYDPRMKKVAAATAAILKKAGVDFGILGNKENCCGESIRKFGVITSYSIHYTKLYDYAFFHPHSAPTCTTTKTFFAASIHLTDLINRNSLQY